MGPEVWLVLVMAAIQAGLLECRPRLQRVGRVFPDRDWVRYGDLSPDLAL